MHDQKIKIKAVSKYFYNRDGTIGNRFREKKDLSVKKFIQTANRDLQIQKREQSQFIRNLKQGKVDLIGNRGAKLRTTS